MNDFWRKIFSWSNSRQRLWDECRLAYYCRYIEKWNYNKNHPFRKELDRLSELTSLDAFQGSVVHEVLEVQINQHMLGRSTDKSAAQAQYVARLKAAERSPEKYLVESVNKQPVDSSLFRKMEDAGVRQIENFFTVFWPVYRSLKYMEHEKFDRFKLHGQLEVVVKVDLVTKSNNNIVITDWKTGMEREEHKEQIGVYVLWAMEKYSVPARNVKAEIVYLDTCGQKIYDLEPVALEDLKNAISLKAGEMLQVNKKEDFSPNPAPWKCKRCNYMTICEWGKRILPETESSP